MGSTTRQLVIVPLMHAQHLPVAQTSTRPEAPETLCTGFEANAKAAWQWTPHQTGCSLIQLQHGRNQIELGSLEIDVSGHRQQYD